MNDNIPPMAGGCLMLVSGMVIVATLQTAAKAQNLESLLLPFLLGFVLIAFIWGAANGFFSE